MGHRYKHNGTARILRQLPGGATATTPRRKVKLLGRAVGQTFGHHQGVMWFMCLYDNTVSLK